MGLAALWVLPLVTADDPGWMAAIGSLRPEVRRLRGRLTSNHILRVTWNEQPAGRSDQPALAALVDRGSDALGGSVKPLAPIDVPLPQSGTPPRCVRRNSARDHHRANYFGPRAVCVRRLAPRDVLLYPGEENMKRCECSKYPKGHS